MPEGSDITLNAFGYFMRCILHYLYLVFIPERLLLSDWHGFLAINITKA